MERRVKISFVLGGGEKGMESWNISSCKLYPWKRILALIIAFIILLTEPATRLGIFNYFYGQRQ